MADAVAIGGGALEGAAQGASIGSTFGPWGTAIGGVAGGLLGGVNAFVSGEHQGKAEEILKKAQESANKKVDAYNAWAAENTGIKANEKAFDLAKAQTGTMTSQTSQSQAYAAQNAQENAGISKSQAAMAGQNAAAGKNAEVYDDLMASNKQTAENAIQSEVAAKQDAVTKEINADIDRAKAEAEAESKKNLLTDVVDKAKDLGSNLASKVKSVGSGIVSGIKSFFSDEDLKRFEEADPQETYLLLKSLVINAEPGILKDNAVNTIKLMEKVYGYR